MKTLEKEYSELRNKCEEIILYMVEKDIFNINLNISASREELSFCNVQVLKQGAEDGLSFDYVMQANEIKSRKNAASSKSKEINDSDTVPQTNDTTKETVQSSQKVDELVANECNVEQPNAVVNLFKNSIENTIVTKTDELVNQVVVDEENENKSEVNQNNDVLVDEGNILFFENTSTPIIGVNAKPQEKVMKSSTTATTSVEEKPVYSQTSTKVKIHSEHIMPQSVINKSDNLVEKAKENINNQKSAEEMKQSKDGFSNVCAFYGQSAESNSSENKVITEYKNSVSQVENTTIKSSKAVETPPTTNESKSDEIKKSNIGFSDVGAFYGVASSPKSEKVADNNVVKQETAMVNVGLNKKETVCNMYDYSCYEEDYTDVSESYSSPINLEDFNNSFYDEEYFNSFK